MPTSGNNLHCRSTHADDDDGGEGDGDEDDDGGGGREAADEAEAEEEEEEEEEEARICWSTDWVSANNSSRKRRSKLSSTS